MELFSFGKIIHLNHLFFFLIFLLVGTRTLTQINKEIQKFSGKAKELVELYNHDAEQLIELNPLYVT